MGERLDESEAEGAGLRERRRGRETEMETEWKREKKCGATVGGWGRLQLDAALRRERAAYAALAAVLNERAALLTRSAALVSARAYARAGIVEVGIRAAAPGSSAKDESY